MPGKRKGALRLALAAGVSEAHACGGLRSTAFRSSDFLGPGTREEALGEAWIAPPGPATMQADHGGDVATPDAAGEPVRPRGGPCAHAM